METQNNKLFVGNLPFSVDNTKLAEIFAAVEGIEVIEAVVITDKFNNNRSKGFGFVTVADEAQAQKAIEALNNQEVEGRAIVVNIAKPLEKRENRSFGGDRGGYRN